MGERKTYLTENKCLKNHASILHRVCSKDSNTLQRHTYYTIVSPGGGHSISISCPFAVLDILLIFLMLDTNLYATQ